MNSSTVPPDPRRAREILAQIAVSARSKFGSDARWASASGVPKETLCRLKKSASCDLRTLTALAGAVDMVLSAVPARMEGLHMPRKFGRTEEAVLLDFCASSDMRAESWAAHGPAYFMAGVATLLASVRGFDRRRYLELADSLHPGITVPEVFGDWLPRSPLQVARFLPQLRRKVRS